MKRNVKKLILFSLLIHSFLFVESCITRFDYASINNLNMITFVSRILFQRQQSINTGTTTSISTSTSSGSSTGTATSTGIATGTSTSTSSSTGSSTSVPTYSISVTVSGTLLSSVTLQLNGGSNLSFSATGSYTFTTQLASGSAYNASIFTAPAFPGKCVFTSSFSGTISGTNINLTMNCRNFKYSFITTSPYFGNVGGLTAIDNVCNTDPARPDTTSTYKALVGIYNGGSAPQRKACGFSAPPANCAALSGSQSTNWVLSANVQYRRADGTTIVGTANTDLIIISFTNPFNATSITIWTGLESSPAWGTVTATSECSGWSTTAGFGNVGDSSTTGASFLNLTNQPCSTSYNFICIEQ